MAHFCKIVDGKVASVIVAEPEFFDTFVDSSPGEWKQCSYNTRGGVHYSQDGHPSSDQSKALRKNYPGVGYTYDAVRDAFIPPTPYASWVLNEDTCLWNAPVAKPDGDFGWDEATLSWKEVVLA